MDGAGPMILDVGLAVRVVTGIRTHTALGTGCLEWEAEGVRAALIGTEGSPGAVLAAACLAAEDSSLRLPSPKAFRRHWPANAATTAPTVRQTLECSVHREDLPCQPCQVEAGPPVDPADLPEDWKRTRAQLAERDYRRGQRPVDLTEDVSAARARIDQEATP